MRIVIASIFVIAFCTTFADAAPKSKGKAKGKKVTRASSSRARATVDQRSVGFGYTYAPAGDPIAFDTWTSRMYAASDWLRAWTERLLAKSEAKINKEISDLIHEDVKKAFIENWEFRNKTRWSLQDESTKRRLEKQFFNSDVSRKMRAIENRILKDKVYAEYYKLFPHRIPNKPVRLQVAVKKYVDYQLPDRSVLRLFIPYVINPDKGTYSHSPGGVYTRGQDPRLIDVQYNPPRLGVATIKE